MKCYNGQCPDHGEFDTCKRGVIDICKDAQLHCSATELQSHAGDFGLNAEEPVPIPSQLPVRAAKMKLFIINGISGSGKDTFCKFVAKNHPGRVCSITSVARVKQFLAVHMGITKKIPELMRLLQKHFITEVNGPFKHTSKRIIGYRDEFNADILFVHVREKDEIQKYVDAFGAKKVLINPASTRGLEACNVPGNEEVYKTDYDYKIYNGFTKQFEEYAKQFIKEISNE